jgi:DNA-binding CsgD family transcriptional regulator
MPSGYNIRYAHDPTEYRLLRLYGQGLHTDAIARECGYDPKTVSLILTDVRERLWLPSHRALRTYAAGLRKEEVSP